MTEALALAILQAVVTYGPAAEAAILGLIKGGKTIAANGGATDAQLQAVAAAIMAYHAALPAPKV